MYTFPNGMIYIGMTKYSIGHRRNCGYHHNNRLLSAIKEFGWKGTQAEILEDGLSYEEACEKEIFYIHDRMSNNPSIGYNISTGGKCTFDGLHHTEEHKRKMSRIMSGRSLSDNTKQKLKMANSKSAKPVFMCDTCGNVIKRFSCLRDAASEVCGHKTNISRSCKSRKPYKGFLWKFESEVI